MKSSLLLVCGLILPVITGSSPAAENLGTGTAAIERIQDCRSGGNTCSTTYPQIYCSADGETHFRDVTVPLTLVPTTSTQDPVFASTINPANASSIDAAAAGLGLTGGLWVVFPKGWGVDWFRQGIFHPNTGSKRFVSMREGTITIRATDGEERTFKKGDIFEALDLTEFKGRLSKSEDGAVALFTNHP